MVEVTVSCKIHAPMDIIFKTISDFSKLPDVSSEIKKIEFLSDTKSGIGTRFRETRIMNNRETVTDLEVTEYKENELIRMVSASHGTVWDSIFKINAVNNMVELKLTMYAKAYKLLPKILNPLFKGMYKNSLRKHLDAIKIYCENQILDSRV